MEDKVALLSESSVAVPREANSSATASPHGAAFPILPYRRDIDGLRALAVLAVVVFHAFPRWVAGGYVGVDIFFVISGFLITSILLTSLAHGSFSFADFYARRARRIFPALVTVLVPVVGFGWFVLTPDEFSTLGKHVAAGAAFVGNISLWLETGYFDISADLKPLLHLWSLGVEEQFYIVWPLLVWAAWRRAWNLLGVCALLGLASFVTNIAAVGQHADAAYFLSFPRFWELLAGGALGYLTVTRGGDAGLFPQGPSGLLARHAASLAGAAILAWSIYTLDKSHAFPGWWALLPVLGTTLIIAAGPRALINRFVLGNRPMVFVGLISYPLYLWHWPLLSYGRILYGDLSKELRVVLIGAAVLLAAATYLLIERRLRRPFLAGHPSASRRQLAVLYGMIASSCVLGLAVFWGPIGARSDARDVDDLLEAQYDRDFPPRSFGKFSSTGPNFFSRGGTAPGYTVYIGDSLMERYAARIEKVMSESGRPHHSAIFATGPGCPALPEVFYVAAHTHPACAAVTQGAYATARRADVSKVVIGADWERDLTAPNAGLVHRAASDSARLDTAEGRDRAFAALERQVALLTRSKKVYIVLSSPKSGNFSPKSMLNGSRWTTLSRRRDMPTVDIGSFIESNAATRARLVEIAGRHGAIVIDPIAALCQGSVCPTVAAGGQPLYMDHLHMRPFYVREAASFLDRTILAD